ncbi:hypothetical protein [Streptomyces syringium]|uniref:hypothetical protein n=1 Tax=Streptomyces syringium TaxID=76729 RepID=UPI0033E0FEF8
MLGEEVADTGLLELAFGQVGDPTAADGPVLDRVGRGVVVAPAASGVTTVEDTGPVDPVRHPVVATRDAPSGLLSDRTAETVRPGYLWRDVLLRPQEVVSYVPYVGPGPREPKPSAEGGTRDDHHRQRPPEIRGPLRVLRRSRTFRELVLMEAGIGWPLPVPVLQDGAPRVYVRLPLFVMRPDPAGGADLFPPFAPVPLHTTEPPSTGAIRARMSARAGVTYRTGANVRGPSAGHGTVIVTIPG